MAINAVRNLTISFQPGNGANMIMPTKKLKVMAIFGTPESDPSDSSFFKAALWLRVSLGFVPRVVIESETLGTPLSSDLFNEFC